MGLLSKLFGGGFDKLIERADRLAGENELGEALIEYERALAGDRSEIDAQRVRDVESRAVALRDRIADRHLLEGDRYREEGNLDEAVEEYRTALQAAGTEGKEDEVQARLDAMEAALARELIGEIREPTADETFQALSGSWDEDQWDEYEEYGDEFKDAYLAYHAGRHEEAVEGYATVVESAGEDGVFILYELGRAHGALGSRLRDKQQDEQVTSQHDREAVDCFERFLDRLETDSAPQLRASAWNELAQIHLEADRPDDAEDALMNAQEAVPQEALAYLNLGRFLLRQERPSEAVDALEAGVEVMDKLKPDFRILSELGLAHRAAGDEERALATLEGAVEGMVQYQQGYYDPYIAIPLAEMMESRDRILDASDLYRHLAQGPDVANHARYNFHSARLLSKIGETDLARSHLARAQELVTDDETQLAEQIEALGSEL